MSHRVADLRSALTDFENRFQGLTESSRTVGELRSQGDLLATRELVEKLLGRLKVEDRRVIELFELEQRSLLEICAELGWNFEFAKMRLFRARGKLRRLLRMTGGLDDELLGWSTAMGAEQKRKVA